MTADSGSGAVRLQKLMAECGLASRRRCEELILAGRVTVNGEPATLGQTVIPDAVDVRVDGRIIGRSELTYILLNKPRGVITSSKDTHGRRTVLDCLSEGRDKVRERLFPVGRLDFDTQGALLLTNDGELANRLMHPRYGVEKVYRAVVRGEMSDETAQRLARGVTLADGKTAPARVTVLRTTPRSSVVRLTLREGKKREVKRMCEKVGHTVVQLDRESIGGIGVAGLKPGESRPLREGEVRRLYDLTKHYERDIEPRAQ